MICAEPAPSEPLRAPAWARPGGSFRDNSEAEALFFAGAALSALDSVAKSDPPWAGVWRRRLALKSAAAVAANLLNRREDEAALRDAIALAKPGQELGPAGRVYAAFRILAGPGDPFRPERLAAVAADLQAPLDPQKAAELAAALREAGGRGRPAPVAAAAAAEAVIALRARRRAARDFCADAALARSLELANAAAAARRRAVRAPRRGRGTAAAPGRGRLDEARGARLRPRGARRPRPGAGPVAPGGPARGRRAKTARQGEGGRASRRCSPTTPSPPRRPSRA